MATNLQRLIGAFLRNHWTEEQAMRLVSPDRTIVVDIGGGVVDILMLGHVASSKNPDKYLALVEACEVCDSMAAVRAIRSVLAELE